MQYLRNTLVIVAIIFVILSIWKTREPFKTLDEDDTIFVSVASYRDSWCSQTVRSLFDNAKFPAKISVGICQQNDESHDADCVEDDPKVKAHENRIRTIRVPHHDAQGPTWARYLCSTLWQGEKYFLQIDSHTLFATDWDEKLVAMIKRLKQEGVKKPLLSHYPKTHDDYSVQQSEGARTVPAICQSFFNDTGMISFLGAQNLSFEKDDLPKQGAYVAAGMFFVESSFLKEVPFDPNLPYLFVGEEILHTIRFWTHGYDIYTPSENVIFHFYTREDHPKVWNESKSYSDKDAVDKVRHLLRLNDEITIAPHLNKNLEVYGLGNARTLAEYFDFAGIDLKTKKVTKDFCGNTTS